MAKQTISEEFKRMRVLAGLINESENYQDKEIVLLDGTSSAGKSHTLGHLNAVPYYKATDPNQWVVIGSDDFSNKKGGEERRLKLDHPSIRKWAKENEEAGIVSGLHRKDGKDIPENPYEDEYIEGTDSRLWYIAQEIKTGPWKKIVIDDIGKDIVKYLPEVNFKKKILLHAPIYLLLKNVSERNERAKNDPKYKGDERNPLVVLRQYTEKYEATKSKPNENKGDPTTVITKGGLTKLFKDNGLSQENIDEVLNKLGITDDGDYYIKVKDSYLTPEIQLVNVDSERTVYLKDIDKAMK